MKKYLPFILLGVGILVVVAVYFLVIRKAQRGVGQEEEVAPEVALNDRPFTSLTPTKDGHWLHLTIDKIKISAATVDYELLYKLPDGRTQGVPGTVTLSGQAKIDRDLLLGSESSGKFRYDEGVSQGTLTLKFRDSSAKLVGKFMTQFHLQTGADTLTSLDAKLTVKLSKVEPKTFFVTMETFGLPDGVSGPTSLVAGPYGVFASTAVVRKASISSQGGKVVRLSGTKWVDVGTSSDLGVFVVTQ